MDSGKSSGSKCAPAAPSNLDSAPTHPPTHPPFSTTTTHPLTSAPPHSTPPHPYPFLQELNTTLHTVLGSDQYDFVRRLVGAGVPNTTAMALVELEQGVVDLLDGSEFCTRCACCACCGSRARCQGRDSGACFCVCWQAEPGTLTEGGAGTPA